MEKTKWSASKGIALSITVGIVLILAGIVLFNILSHGYDYGKYTESELPTDLFDFFEALSGRRSEYKKEIMSLQYKAIICAVVACIPCGILLLKASKRAELNVGLLTFGSTLTGVLLLTCLLVVSLYSFSGSPRIAIVVLFFLAAILMAVFMGKASMRLGLYALPLLIFALALGFGIAIFVAQIVGLAAVVFQDLIWILLLMLLFGGGGGSTVVYVIVL